MDCDVLDGVYAVGRREGILKKLVVEYKYQSRRGFARTLAELLAGAVPSEVAERLVSEQALVVPLPTIDRHIRERGFDHTAKMAKEFTRMTGLTYAPLLKRVNKTVQVGSDERTRKKQASEAYEIVEKVFATRPSGPSPWADGAGTRAAALRIPQRTFPPISLKLQRPVLLVDDIWTTGASMTAAAQKIRQAGFKEVLGVVVAVGLKGGRDGLAAHPGDGADDELDDRVGEHTDN